MNSTGNGPSPGGLKMVVCSVMSAPLILAGIAITCSSMSASITGNGPACARAHAAASNADNNAGASAASPCRYRVRMVILRYILKTPNLVSGISALSAADRPRPSTMRVSAGSITPSSHRRAVA